ncbi:MAG: DUF1573 domain-containing protein [Rikenellaceae bacterium]
MMKYILITIALLLYGLSSRAQNSIEFSSVNHDFGTIEESGGDVKCNFFLKNISDKPIIITKIRSGCSCVTTSYSRKPLLPQATDTLRVTFDPRFRTGVLQKNITVDISSEQTSTVLTISGFVKK